MESKKGFTADEARNIGEILGIKWDKFDVEQFRMGMDIELEHGLIDPATNVTNDDSLITGKIALAHLNEFQDYYTRLKKMEEEAERGKFSCESCGEEITEEEYKKHNRMCKKCFL